MASELEMSKQDMIELYQLLRLYSNTYHVKKDTAELLENVYQRYEKVYGEDIREAHNPRNAGRKKQYSDEIDQRILDLRKEKYTLRKIAEIEGCSLGRVQKVLNRGVYSN